MEWQPIETAPKDGDILVWFDHDADPYQDPDSLDRITAYAVWVDAGDYLTGNGVTVAKWFPQQWEAEDQYGSGYWLPAMWFARENGDYDHACNATHWMPRPHHRRRRHDAPTVHRGQSASCLRIVQGSQLREKPPR